MMCTVSTSTNSIPFFTDELKRQGIAVRHTLELLDLKQDRIKEVTTVDERLVRNSITTEPYVLGIMGEDGIRVRFENPYRVILRNMGVFLVTSILVVIILIWAILLLIHLVFYQRKVSKIREDFVNSMVHELRHPVAFIRSALLNIQVIHFAGDPRIKEYVEPIDKQAKLLGQMFEKLLVEATGRNRLNLSVDTFPIRDEIQDLVARYRDIPNADDELPRIETDMEDAPQTLDADKVHYMNAIGNLLDNAIKYSRKEPHIRIRCYRENGWFHVSVKDNGIGIPAEYRDKIFEAYFRVYDRRRSGAYGFGLGLGYVRMVAKAHRGRVEVNSDGKSGSEFVLSIPIQDE